MPDLARRIVKPQDCVLACAFPTSRPAFDAHLERQERGKFASEVRNWDHYWAEVARPAARLLPRIRKLGACVEEHVTLADFGRLFREGFTVVILMAHWRNEKSTAENRAASAVEFADGFAGVDEVVARIPPDAARIIDLSVCTSKELTLAIRRDRQGCVTRSNPVKRVTPGPWFYVYFYVICKLHRHEMTYFEVLEKVILEIQSQTHGKKKT